MQFTVPADHPCLPGHFPGRPLVPGVVVLDRVLAAVEVASGRPIETLGLPQVKFLLPLLPGEAARVELQSDAATPLRWRFRVLRGEDLLANGEVVIDAGRAVDDRGAGA